MDQNYAVLHITKYKSLGAIGGHIDRKHFSENVNNRLSFLNESKLGQILGDEIDSSRTFLCESLVSSKYNNLEKDVREVISKSYKSTNKIRSNAVLALGVILTGSHERMKEIECDEKLFSLWKKSNYDFACREFGESNIVRFTLHRDERTPHIHCVYVPIIGGRLSARDCLGGKLFLSELQDRYANAMSVFGLKRGVSSAHTAVHHVKTRDYYRSIREKKQKITDLLEEITPTNIFGLGDIKKDIVKELDRLITKQVEQEIELPRLSSRNAKYSDNIKANIDKDLELLKRNVNLVELSCNMGYVIDKSKSCKTYVTVKNDNDTLVIKCPIKTPHWQYFSVVNSEDKGTTIDFMLNRGYTYKEIRNLVNVELDSRYSYYYKSLPDTNFSCEEQTKRALFKFDKFGASSAINYLTARGIKEGALSALTFNNTTHNKKEEVLKSKVDEAIFKLYKDFNNTGAGYVCSTIIYKKNDYGKDGKYFQRGLPRGIVVLGDMCNYDKVMVTESPIDALSHKSLYPDTKHVYVSTCGSITKDINKDLQTIFKMASVSNNEVVLSFDNDEPGKYMSEYLSYFLKKEDIKYSVLLPCEGKDWNSLLTDNFKMGSNILKSMLSVNSEGFDEEIDEDQEEKRKRRMRLKRD